MGGIFSSEGDSDPPMGISYFFGLMKMVKTPYDKYILLRSTDDGETANVIEPGTTAILRHDAVKHELESYCARWTSGSLVRGNDLGMARLNSKLWQDLTPPHNAINSTVEQHALPRPIFSNMLSLAGGTGMNNKY